MLTAEEGAVCAAHPDARARFICQRCGDFGCDGCRVGDRCRTCAARTAASAGAYAPLPAKSVTRMLVASCVLLTLTAASLLVCSNTPRFSVTHEVALAFACVAVLFALPCLFLFLRRGGANPIRNMRLSRRTVAAARLYTEGRYGDAAAALESLCHESVGYPRTHALAVQSLGAASLALGEVERGRELMRAAARSGWFETFTLRLAQGPAILHGGLASAARMADDSDAAQRHLEIARARCGRGKEGLLSYPEAYCELRDGRYAEVAHAHARRLGALAKPLRLLQEVPLTSLYAFALEQLGRAEDAAAALRDVASPQRDGRHRGLGARWPEMTAFLERHGLVPAAAVSPEGRAHPPRASRFGC